MVAHSRALGGLRNAHAELAASQKPMRGQAYSVLVNRPLGRWLASAASVVGLRPNQVTTISAAVTATAIAVLAATPASWTTGLIVTSLLVTGYALDAADGQLARLTGGSVAGEFLDHIFDSAKLPALHLATAISLHRGPAVDDRILLIPLGFAVVSAVSFSSMLLRDLLDRVTRSTRPTPQPQTSASSAWSLPAMLVRLPVDYGVLCLSFLLLGDVDVFVVVYAVLFAAWSAHVVLAAPRWLREMKALG